MKEHKKAAVIIPQPVLTNPERKYFINTTTVKLNVKRR
jgi:hypothetical protein